MEKIFRSFDEPKFNLNDKNILVTGGTGSFGQAFVKCVLNLFKPKKLIVFSRDEQKHFEMSQKFRTKEFDSLRYFIGDVRDFSRLEIAMRNVDIVIHAAAMKHVPTSEYNPLECVRTNIGGAENVVRAAIANKVKKVIALSTDKACSPINLYGASKLASDKIFIAANNLVGENDTRFAVVRYGNVIGSKGSVLPTFKRLLDEGATELPITDSRMTRFWITLNQGVKFVLSSSELMLGGEIFIPKIPSMKIVDLASHLAPNIKINIIGIRPGEKLHESMSTIDDSRHMLELGDRYIIVPSLAFWNHDNYFQEGAKNVEDGFYYSSNNNLDWLDTSNLDQFLNNAE